MARARRLVRRGTGPQADHCSHQGRATMRFMSYAAAASLAAVFAVNPAPAAEFQGAGATFPYPIYAKWADAYKRDRHGLELPVDRLGRRHQADRGQDGDVRRHRQAARRQRSSTTTVSSNSPWSWAASFPSSMSTASSPARSCSMARPSPRSSWARSSTGTTRQSRSSIRRPSFRARRLPSCTAPTDRAPPSTSPTISTR